MDLKSITAEVFLLPVKLYRKYISPMKPPVCKYYPSCSAYALEAVRTQGIARGTILAVWRLLRCNPCSNGGVDYVPFTPDENGGYRPANALAVSIARNTAETGDKETKRTGAST